MRAILEAYHSSMVRGHHGGVRTSTKVLQSGFYWPTFYYSTHELVRACHQFQGKEESQ